MKDYKRLTERDEFGNADIIGLDSEKISENLSFKELNLLTKALNRFACLEDKIESGELCEQKTCKNISDKHPVDEFICSKCGFHYEDFSETRYDEDGEYSYKVEFVTKYCPNCGAKVEDDNE